MEEANCAEQQQMVHKVDSQGRSEASLFGHKKSVVNLEGYAQGTTTIWTLLAQYQLQTLAGVSGDSSVRESYRCLRNKLGHNSFKGC